MPPWPRIWGIGTADCPGKGSGDIMEWEQLKACWTGNDAFYGLPQTGLRYSQVGEKTDT